MSSNSEKDMISQRDIDLLREKFPREEDFEEALRLIEDRVPLAYIIGEWYFYGETYKVNPACLIPRPDTEHLVDQAIKLLPKNGRFADLCTGSGCIAISTLVHREDTRGYAADISPDTLEIAKYNAEVNGVAGRLIFSCIDVLNGSLDFDGEPLDMIISNPPYIETDTVGTLEPEVLYEPKLALDGGTDGLDFYRALIKKCPPHIKDGGWLIFEIGYNQGEALIKLSKEAGGRIGEAKILKDYGRNDRVALIQIGNS